MMYETVKETVTANLSDKIEKYRNVICLWFVKAQWIDFLLVNALKRIILGGAGIN